MWTDSPAQGSGPCDTAARRGFFPRLTAPPALPHHPQELGSRDRMPQRKTGFFHLHLVSDATGETLITVARAAAAQYATISPIEHVYPLVRSAKQLDRVLDGDRSRARHRALHPARPGADRPAGSEMPRARPPVPVDSRPGAPACSRPISAPRRRRGSAPSTCSMPSISSASTRSTTRCCMTMASTPTDLEEADVVLVGVSRTSKTPTSIYLANRGVKTANVPLVPGIPPPPQLDSLTKPLVVGLYASPERIVQIRQNRLLGLKAHREDDPMSTARPSPRRSRSRGGCAPAQLAGDRRHPPLDRGDGGRRHRPARRTAPAGRPLTCAVACARAAGARLEEREPRAVLEAAGIPVEIVPAEIDERASRPEPALGTAAMPRSAGRRRRRAVAARLPSPPRPWRRPDAGARRRRFSKPADLAAARDQLRDAARPHPRAPLRICPGSRRHRRLCAEVDAARLTMRSFPTVFSTAIFDAAGARSTGASAAISWRNWRSAVRASRGRPFHHSRPAVAAAPRLRVRRTADSFMTVTISARLRDRLSGRPFPLAAVSRLLAETLGIAGLRAMRCRLADFPAFLQRLAGARLSAATSPCRTRKPLPRRSSIATRLRKRSAPSTRCGYEGGRLLGSNTDAYGFLANLDAPYLGWDRRGAPGRRARGRRRGARHRHGLTQSRGPRRALSTAP